VFGTSFGATNPAVAPGEIPAAATAVTAGNSVTLGGRELPAGNILYLGVTPGNPGLYQLNLVLPEDTPAGDLPLVLRIGGAASPAGPYLTVARR
jgi:uncharacterized protein (TIGR03437 family)